MVFNVLARNCDDHTKNFAFRLQMDGKWELAPAYDICHAYSPDHRWVSQHALSINSKRKDITKADLISLASSINVKKADNIINDVRAAVSRWKDFAEEVGVSGKLRDGIGGTLSQMT